MSKFLSKFLLTCIGLYYSRILRVDSAKVTLGKVCCKSRGGPSWLKVVGPWFQCVQQATVGQPDHTGVQWSRPRPQLGHADCTGHVVPGARPCALGTFSYLVTSRSYFCLSYPNRFL